MLVPILPDLSHTFVYREVLALKQRERTGKGQAIDHAGHEEYAAADAEDVNQEKIVKGRR